MNRVHGKLAAWLASSCLLSMLCVLPAVTQDQSSRSQSSTATDQSSSTTKAKKKKKTKKTKKTKGESTSAAAESEGNPSTAPATNAAKKSSVQSSGAASDSDIAAAKSSGKVWVNLDSGIYHKSGRWYGKTKNGKFMTEKEAKAAGYKPAQKE